MLVISIVLYGKISSFDGVSSGGEISLKSLSKSDFVSRILTGEIFDGGSLQFAAEILQLPVELADRRVECSTMMAPVILLSSFVELFVPAIQTRPRVVICLTFCF